VQGADRYEVFRYVRISPEKEKERRAKIESRQRKAYVLRVSESEIKVGEDIRGTRFVDETAKSGERYIYRVRSVNKYGPSKMSKEIEPRPPEATPPTDSMEGTPPGPAE
jgi:hypothetical protein